MGKNKKNHCNTTYFDLQRKRTTRISQHSRRDSTPICTQCNVSGHSLKTCRRSDLICHHCEGHHRSFPKNCSRYKHVGEIIKIQTRERVPKTEAEQRLLEENPNKLNHAKALKQTPNTSTMTSTSAKSNTFNNDLNDTSEINPNL